MSMLNLTESKESILVVIMEQENVDRMAKADPITLESISRGGFLPAPEFPEQFSILVAYEPDSKELQARAAVGGVEFLMWLERGRKWIEGTDGRRDPIVIGKGKQ
jgi:hypothetical protein